MLSFHILFAWVKHQIVDVNIQDLSYAKNSVVYIEFPMCWKFNFSWCKTYFSLFDKFLN